MADDYARRIYVAMASNTKTYAELIGEKHGLTGLEQCFVTNSTYRDCPISKYEDSNEQFTMNVVVHNPSSIDMPQARIAVPHGHF